MKNIEIYIKDGQRISVVPRVGDTLVRVDNNYRKEFVHEVDENLIPGNIGVRTLRNGGKAIDESDYVFGERVNLTGSFHHMPGEKTYSKLNERLMELKNA